MDTFFDAIARERIEYRIFAEDHGYEALIRKQDVDCVRNVVRSLDFQFENYEFSSDKGYVYRYGMHEPISVAGDNQYSFFCEIPCHSLTPYNIIPLEKRIQDYAWCDPQDIAGYMYSNIITMYLYRITNCVFRKKEFDDNDQIFFQNNRQVLSNSLLKELLSQVFYSYTDQLMKYIDNREYQSIVSSYIKWKDY